MARLCCFSLHSWATWMRTGSGWPGFWAWRLDDIFLHWSAWGKKNNKVSAVKYPLADTTRQLSYLVGVHGQEGFVELDSLKLLLHQFVFDTFSICKFNFFLWVKHILVLWKQVFHRPLTSHHWRSDRMIITAFNKHPPCLLWWCCLQLQPTVPHLTACSRQTWTQPELRYDC